MWTDKLDDRPRIHREREKLDGCDAYVRKYDFCPDIVNDKMYYAGPGRGNICIFLQISGEYLDAAAQRSREPDEKR